MAIDLRLDVPALNRLIGGDSEIEVKLRESVARAFTEKHFIKVFNSKQFTDLVNKRIDEIKLLVSNQIDLKLKKDKIVSINTFGGISLTTDFKQKVKNEITDTINIYVNKIIYEKINESINNLVPDIDIRVQSQLDIAIQSIINKAVNARLDKIKNMINL